MLRNKIVNGKKREKIVIKNVHSFLKSATKLSHLKLVQTMF